MSELEDYKKHVIRILNSHHKRYIEMCETTVDGTVLKSMFIHIKNALECIKYEIETIDHLIDWEQRIKTPEYLPNAESHENN